MLPPAVLWRYLGATPTRQFAAVSLLVIGLITVAFCLLLSSLFRRDLLEREWRTTTDYVRTEALQTLTPADFGHPWRPEAQRRFRTFYEQTVMMPDIVRVKIYDRSMTVIWSDEPRLVGRRFTDNDELQEAVTGRTVVDLEVRGVKGENVYEKSRPRLVEVYVPLVFPGTSTVVGVAETYKDPAAVFANIARGQATIVIVGVASALLLYLSLFWIVQRAARRIEQQHRTLEHRTRALGAANDELRSVQDQLVGAERMAAVGEIVTAVAHGIRNPLANIRASAQVALLDCQSCTGSPLGPTSMRNVMSEVDRLEHRLKDLLEYVRPAARQSRPVDVNAVVRASHDLLRARVREAGVTVHDRLAPGLPVVSGDPMLLEEVFVTLIGNAVEAMPAAGGTITLVSGTDKDADGEPAVFVEVRDTGEGIPPEHLPRIFHLFHTTKPQGTGLGLAMAKKFIEAHGGTIGVDSRVGEGATFRVTLPMPPAA